MVILHQAKLIMAYSRLPYKILAEDKITIIDYGCGQGIASIAFCDYVFHKLGRADIVSDFYIIDPSKNCLKRAIDYIHSLSPKSNITYFNNPCEDILCMDIHPKSECVIHLFSNVIDMPDFPRGIVVDKINEMNEHNNIVVCVSPFYNENRCVKYMDEFCDKIKGFSCIYSLEKHINEWEEPYSCQIRILKNSWF